MTVLYCLTGIELRFHQQQSSAGGILQTYHATTSYLEGIPKKALQLAVIGKDPFPSDPTGIPFCKPSWDQQLDLKCSGRYVLLALGLDVTSIQEKYSKPKSLFEFLREEGIVFLNASYVYTGGQITQTKHLQHLKAAYTLNKSIIESARAVIYCGEASKIRWIAPIEKPESYCVVHPDVRNKNRKITSDRWRMWWGPNALIDRLNIKCHSN